MRNFASKSRGREVKLRLSSRIFYAIIILVNSFRLHARILSQMFHSMMTYYDILYTAVWYSWIELFRIRITHERKGKEKEKKTKKITKNIRRRVRKKLKEENALSIVRQDHNEWSSAPSLFSAFYAARRDFPDTLRVPPPPRLLLLAVVSIRDVECRP